MKNTQELSFFQTQTQNQSKNTIKQPAIIELENNLKTLKQQKQTDKTLQEIREITSKIKKQKELNKLTVSKLEINNLSHLFFFDSTNGYKKLTENSAIIYAGNIAKRIGRRVNLKTDTDNYAKSEFGTVSIILSEELVEKFSAIGITKDEELSTPHIHAFKLSEPISESYFRTLQDTLKKDSEHINQIIMPKNLIPTLFIYLKELLEILFYTIKNMPEFPRDIFGKEILKMSDEMITEYLRFTDGKISKLDLATTLYISSTKLKRKLKTFEILHLISNHNICRILEKTIAIERLSAKYYKEESIKK